MKRVAVAAVLVAVVTLCVYAPVRHHDFVNFDDGEYVVDNPHVSTGLSIANLRWGIDNAYVGTGGPLTWASHMLDVSWFGLDAGRHHITSLALHTINAILLLVLLWRLTNSPMASGAVAALFALHPMHVESVAWIAERKDVLSTLFLFLTVLAYVAYVRSPGRLRYALVAVLLVIGLLAKPMLVTTPFLLLLLDIWPLGRVEWNDTWHSSLRTLAVEKLPLALPCIVVIVLTWRAQQVDALAGVDVLPLGMRFSNAAVSCVTYIARMFWPTHLAVFYPYPHSIPLARTAVCLAMLVAGTAVAAWRLPRQPYLLVGWLWFLGSLAPVIGIVQVGGHAMADRFTYVPLVGLFIAIVWAGRDLAARSAGFKSAIVLSAVSGIAVLALMTREQVAHWRDSASLWTHAIAVTHDNDRAHANLGVVLALAERHADAILEYRTALRIDPRLPIVHNNLGLALQRTGQPDAALAEYREAIRLAPRYARAYQNLGVLLAREGHPEDAIGQWQEAVRIDPDLIEAHVNIATTAVQLDRLDVALLHALEAVRLAPDNAQWHYVAGSVLAMRDETAAAITHLERALAIAPDFTDARNALRALKGGH